ncbi:MAG: hypothetical protein UU47_C0016G0012 [candidate division TM6 bacterium GW2011_GWE2_41_16]|nr:MAG: hypothetical protein UU47_C0016G0012 [candidate division TM6 bacterium GW2011_GWE2_41_16]
MNTIKNFGLVCALCCACSMGAMQNIEQNKGPNSSTGAPACMMTEDGEVVLFAPRPFESIMANLKVQFDQAVACKDIDKMRLIYTIMEDICKECCVALFPAELQDAGTILAQYPE